jgi:mannose-1-phosphate guanylyltransferase/mannose-6-phosphate isomerase
MIPVVLSGGSGTRLWPVSRAAFPKQFNDLVGEPLLAQTLRRLTPLGVPWVVAVQATETLTRTVLRDLGVPDDQALFEPVGRNTAPAVALLCHVLRGRGLGDEVVGIFPADHLITRENTFQDATRLAEECARQGRVVTLGIHPHHPATGYGYIEVTDQVVGHVDDANPEGLDALGCAGFHEKPDPETAQRFVESGCFYWNSGMFVFRVDDMAAHFERLMPELWESVQRVEADLSNLAEVYEALPAESLDYGVMEHLEPDQLACIPCAPGWSDLGSWDEVARRRSQHTDVYQEAGDGNFVYGHRKKVYGFVGVSDLVLVDTADATLVAARGRTESVKGLVGQVREGGHRSASEHTFEKRPWGEFEVLRDTDHFKSKILRVAPMRRLSYQSHRHRSEHWVIVQGQPEVVLDGRTLNPQPGESVFIPQGAKHRIVNPTEEWVELVEVQVGSYFGEDDIIRYEDDYARV